MLRSACVSFPIPDIGLRVSYASQQHLILKITGPSIFTLQFICCFCSGVHASHSQLITLSRHHFHRRLCGVSHHIGSAAISLSLSRSRTHGGAFQIAVSFLSRTVAPWRLCGTHGERWTPFSADRCTGVILSWSDGVGTTSS